LTRGRAKSCTLVALATTFLKLLFPCNMLPKSYCFCCCATCKIAKLQLLWPLSHNWCYKEKFGASSSCSVIWHGLYYCALLLQWFGPWHSQLYEGWGNRKKC
jgi:hypothetical protein